MKLKMVGTSHSKTIPHPLCFCNVCEKARFHGGPDVRTRTSVHIHLQRDEDDLQPVRYKVDLGPDTAWQMMQHECDLRYLQHLLITHSHGDHFTCGDLVWRAKRNRDELPELFVYGPPAVGAKLESALINFDGHGIIFREMSAYDWYQVGDIEVYPIMANHIRDQICLNYVIRFQGRTVFLAWDTGLWSEEAWEHLRQFCFDAIVLECTFLAERTGDVDEEAGHMTTDSFIAAREMIGAHGLIKEDTPCIATHICDNGLTHDEGQAVLAAYGCRIAYDGMELTL